MTAPVDEMPVEAGARSGTMELVARPLSPLLLAVDIAARAVERGELQREPAPVIPAPIATPTNFEPAYVPREYRAATFEYFNPDIAGAKHAEELTIALRTAQKWEKDARHGRRNLLALVGPQGNGKSLLLYSAVNRLTSNRVRVFSRPWYRLADELRYGGPSPWALDGPVLPPEELRRTMYRARVVVIDEVRPTAGTAFDDTELAKFACHAWDEGVAVLITTNVNPLANVMGAAAADRFTVVTLNAPSRRQEVD